MSSTITNNLRVTSAQKFINSIDRIDNSLYSYIAKSDPWTDEASVPPVQISDNNSNIVLSEILYMKKIVKSGAILAIKKYDWKQNEVYSMYRSDIDMFDYQNVVKPFYVLTDEFNVYKCVYNNNGKPSKVKPTGKTKNIFTSYDGYFWKYMFSVDDQYKNFITNEFVPIINKTEIVDTSRGINAFYIENSGTNYVGSTVNINLVGDGTGFSGYANIKNGKIDSITITNKGKNYRSATATLANSTTGTTAIIKPMMDPPLGHGSSPAQELGANYVLISSTFFQNEDFKISIKNDYRKIGILENPLSYKTELPITDELLAQVHKIKISDIIGADFVTDDIVIGQTSGVKARVLEYDNSNFILYLCQANGEFLVNEEIKNLQETTSAKLLSTETASTGNVVLATINTITIDPTFSGLFDPDFDMIIRITSGTGQNQRRIFKSFNSTTKSGTLTNSWEIIPDSTSQYAICYYKLPDVKYDSGNILYSANIKKIQRDVYQNEEFTYVIEF